MSPAIKSAISCELQHARAKNPVCAVGNGNRGFERAPVTRPRIVFTANGRHLAYEKMVLRHGICVAILCLGCLGIKRVPIPLDSRSLPGKRHLVAQWTVF